MRRDQFLQTILKTLFDTEGFGEDIAEHEEKIVLLIVSIASASAGVLLKLVLEEPETSCMVRVGISGFALTIGMALAHRFAAREVRYWNGRVRFTKQGIIMGWMSGGELDDPMTIEEARRLFASLDTRREGELKEHANSGGAWERAQRLLLLGSFVVFAASGVLVVLGIVW